MSMRTTIRITYALLLLSLLSLSARGQVILRLNSDHFSTYDPIEVTIVNHQSKPISVCIGEQWNDKANGDIEVTRTPLLFQVQNGRQWVTVLNGVDLSPMSYPLTIDPRESQLFHLQTNEKGKGRFVLSYWDGDNSLVCNNPVGGKKSISRTFTVHGSPKKS